MASTRTPELDEMFDQIEAEILPNLSMMLGTLLDSALLARSGADSEAQANELRAIAARLDGIREQVEAVSSGRAQPAGAASAA